MAASTILYAVCVTCLFSCVVAYVTQVGLDQDSKMRVQTEHMVTFCHEVDSSYNPHFSTFTFDAWTDECFLTAPANTYPSLYNTLLAAVQQCEEDDCPEQRTSVSVPQLTCQGRKTDPHTFSISFDCRPDWPHPVTTTTTPAQSNTTTIQRTTARPPRTRSTTAIPTTIQRTTARPPITRRTTVSEVGTRLPTEQSTRERHTTLTNPSTSSSLTTRSVINSTPTTSSTLSSSIPDARIYNLTAIPANQIGYLTLNAKSQACSELADLRVVGATYYSLYDVSCDIQYSARYLQSIIQSATNDSVLVSQPYCGSRRASRLIVYYRCNSEVSKSTRPITTSTPFTSSNKTTDLNARLEDSSDTDSHLSLILGIAIPLALLLIIVPITVFLVVRRTRDRKSLLSRVDEDSYRDPHSHSFTNINAAYVDEYGVYHDPALFRKPARNSAMCQSIQSIGGIYQDPILTAGTGPPETLSPIQEAVLTNHTTVEPTDSEFNDVYADPEMFRGNPDGQTKEDQIYDMPYSPRRPVPPPRPNLPHPGAATTSTSTQQDDGKPMYTHMLEEHESHNYATIRKSRPNTESQYYDLENSVKLFESPVYDSIEDVYDSSHP